MPIKFRWIDTTGGPHLLAPIEQLSAWRGVEGWRGLAPDDPSDYARACRVESWAGVISIGRGVAAVFGGDFGIVTWVPRGFDGGLFVQWIGCESDDQIEALIADEQGLERFARDDAQEVTFETGPTGRMILFDSTELGVGDTQQGDRQDIAVRPGQYCIRSELIEAPDCHFVIRRLTWIAEPRLRLVSSVE